MHPVTRPDRVDESVIRALPKAEVHVHLEGGFALADLLALAKENGTALPGPAATLFDVSTHETYRAPEVTSGGGVGAGSGGLSAFLSFLDWQCGLVRTAAQAARVAYAFAARQSASGIRYTDVIVNPTHWNAWHGRELALIAALTAGFDEAQQDGLCAVNIAYSLLRDQSAAEAEEIVAGIANARPRRVVALSVDGDEKVTGPTGRKFQAAFAAAASAGLRRTVHAGESSGPEGVWEAIDLLGAERIDHGVRAVEDPALLRRLAEGGISLGVCPRSNLTLGIYPGWAAHPLPRLLEAGVAVTLNTDDPAPMGTTLEADWAVTADQFGFGFDDLVGFAERSIAACFAGADTKTALRAELARTAAALRPQPATTGALS
jgi:adenosine deaminase